MKYIDLTIPKGSSLGIVGKTSSGKTSLLNLITRFYEVSNGEVLIDNINVKEYSLTSLRSQISGVFQNSGLFTGSIRENMLIGNPNASDEEIINVLKQASIWEFVNNQPEKLDYVITQSGNNLSGGQKQRFYIARALLKKAKILILDDATSAIDTKTEQEIKLNLNNIKEVTKIIVAQKISSVLNCDQILVIDEGKISDIGTHSELMLKNKYYREMYEIQNSLGSLMRYRRDIYSLKTSKISNKDRFSTFSKIINLLWKDYKYKLLFSVFLIIISTGGMLYNQVFIGKIIVDNFLSDYKNKPFDYENFYLVVTLSALWFFITVLAGFFWKRILIKVTIKTLTKLRTNLYIHIQSLPIAFFDNNKKGDLMSRFTSDIETLRDFISNSLPRIMDTIITLSVSVVVMFILNWLLSLIMIIMMVVILLFSYFIGQQSKKAFVLRQKNNGILSGFTEEAISSIKTIKIFTQEKNMINKYQKLSNELYKNELKARGLRFTFSFFNMNGWNRLFNSYCFWCYFNYPR
ncbi:ABC transporter transmembrane domain-containing protein [Mycoplasmopsis felis]|uniref:ABC transporter transmembrane domain-containing protein n=1 Tax=Mycoplasmopsis felis TaxID=33923 RepID=UPI0021DF8361|nr:ABC transporter transmembrane domain-containing protein [Mycoplasmopsis felis]MCU9938297.1 ABC transporter transmembrane domain-containing protein [Mycoplasmopsis felis]